MWVPGRTSGSRKTGDPDVVVVQTISAPSIASAADRAATNRAAMSARPANSRISPSTFDGVGP